MSKMIQFKKETDKKNRTFIIEGEVKPGNVFSIHRFICEVQQQETEKQTQDIADRLLAALKLDQVLDIFAEGLAGTKFPGPGK